MKTRKEKLAEIEKIKKEIVELGGVLDYTKKDLDKIEEAKFHLQNERSELDKFSMTLNSKQSARLKELNQILPKLEIQLRIDKLALANKQSGTKLIQENNSFRIEKKKIGKSFLEVFS